MPLVVSKVFGHAAIGLHFSSSERGVGYNGRRRAHVCIDVLFRGRAAEGRGGFSLENKPGNENNKKVLKKNSFLLNIRFPRLMSQFCTIVFLINILRFFNKYSFFFRKVRCQLGTVVASGPIRRRGRARGDKGNDSFGRIQGRRAQR